MIAPLLNRLKSRTLSIQLFQAIEEHVCCHSFIKQLETPKTVDQFSWVCLHWWIVDYRIRTPISSSRHPLLMGKNWSRCLQQYTRDHVYEYGEFFDHNVYSELKRRSTCLTWSLTDYYTYSFTTKPVHQILVQDLMGTTVDQVSVNRLQKSKKYFEDSMNLVNNMQWSDIEAGIKWPSPINTTATTAKSQEHIPSSKSVTN